MDRFAEGAVDAVLTDMRLPDIDGLDLVAIFTQMAPEIPVIVMTGYGSMETALEAMRRGARDFVQKPFVVEDVIRLLERALWTSDSSAGRTGASAPSSSAASRLAGSRRSRRSSRRSATTPERRAPTTVRRGLPTNGGPCRSATRTGASRSTTSRSCSRAPAATSPPPHASPASVGPTSTRS